MADSSILDWISDQQPRLESALIKLANINSGSGNAVGNRNVAVRMDHFYSLIGASRSRVAMPPEQRVDDNGELQSRELGSLYSWSKRLYAPLRILLVGHTDTVFPESSHFQKVERVGRDVLHGPGVADLKGGLMVMWSALAALERHPAAENIGWTVILNPDEEIGSPSSAAYLQEQAKHHHFGMVYEPTQPNGGLIGERGGTGNYTFVIRGKAAHTGRNHGDGRSAILAASRLALALDALNGGQPGFNITPAVINGGSALNSVPDKCLLRVNVRLREPEHVGWVNAELHRLLAIINEEDGINATLHGGVHRPPKPWNERQQQLADLVKDCADQLHIPFSLSATGGCCDGNNLANSGLPNLDTLGVVGGDIHTDKEWMYCDSLAERSKLSALLMLRLASGELKWPASASIS